MFFDTPNANPFLDNRPGNRAPNGLEGNPGGTNPVFTLTTAASEGSPLSSCRVRRSFRLRDALVHRVNPMRRLQRRQGFPLSLQLQLQPPDRAVTGRKSLLPARVCGQRRTQAAEPSEYQSAHLGGAPGRSSRRWHRVRRATTTPTSTRSRASELRITTRCRPSSAPRAGTV